MASQTEIISKALTQIGATTVTSIDENSANALTLKRVYKSSLESILSECKWNFATRRALLSVSTDSVDWYDVGEGIIYNRPSDAIRIFGVNSPTALWREEGEYIISDTAGLGVRYVYYHDTPNQYPSFFVDAFVDRLSFDIAYSIVNSTTLGETYKKLYEGVSLPKAMSKNSQIGIQQTVQDDAWELAKYNNVSPNA